MRPMPLKNCPNGIIPPNFYTLLVAIGQLLVMLMLSNKCSNVQRSCSIFQRGPIYSNPRISKHQL